MRDNDVMRNVSVIYSGVLHVPYFIIYKLVYKNH